MPVVPPGSGPLQAPGALAVLGLGHMRPKPGRLAMPDVCCDLVWGRRGLVVSGPSTVAKASQNVGHEVWLLRVDPLVACVWLRTPLDRLTDTSVPLADIDPRLARELEPLKEAGRLDALVRPAGDVTAAGIDPRLVAATRALRTGQGVGHVAERIGWSTRQLERVFTAQLGMPPKTFARLLRFRRALRAATTGAPLADAAAIAGFADQAHFSRDARKLTGVSPRVLLPHVGNVQDVVAGTM